MSAKPRVYVDSCVLVLAAQASEGDIAIRAMEELDRPDVEYVFTALVEHEVLPNPIRNGYLDQVEFYREFLAVATRVSCDEAEQQHAFSLRLESAGLGLVDALHLSAAARAGVQEFVTAEGPTKPMNASTPASVRPMQVRTIRT
jgi:predicted nucleic acid-binding protein